MGDPPVETSSRALAERYEDTETVYSALGSTARRGPWEPPERMRLVSVIGSIVLDYRDVELPLGETIVECAVYLGNVEIIAPADADVELTGSVFLGNVETRGGAPSVEPGDESERPLLTVVCSGAMGNVEVELP